MNPAPVSGGERVKRRLVSGGARLPFGCCHHEVLSRCFCVANSGQTCAKSVFYDSCAHAAVNGVDENDLRRESKDR